MNVDERKRVAQRTMRKELACARALLDAFESVLEAPNDEVCRDLVEQAAIELALVAVTMKNWAASQHENEPALAIENAS